MKNTIITLSILFASVAAYTQNFTVLGKVVDSATKSPLVNASAFCPNTTHGTVSNGDGLFFLRLPDGGYDLVISYTGYEKKLYRVGNNISLGDTLVVELVKQEKVMEEVAVVGSNEVKDGWTKYGQFFLENFIGTSPNAANCQLQNPEAVRFFFNKKRNRLKVTAREDLIIKNHNLGYSIRYQLDSFTYEFNNQISQFTGYPLFTEMDTTAEARIQFVKNRARTYLGSRMHFMRSFYNSRLSDEGFIVEQIPSGKGDAVLITDPYNPEQYGLDSGEVVIGWQGRYRVSYKSVLPDKRFLTEFKLPANSRYQTTVVDVQDGFVIERNGYFYEQDGIINTGYWAWKKLAEALPYDYVYQ